MSPMVGPIRPAKFTFPWQGMGRKEPRGAIPAAALRMMGRFGDLMSLFLPGTFPVDSGAVVACWTLPATAMPGGR